MKPLTTYVVPLFAAGLIALTGCSAGDSHDSTDNSSSRDRAHSMEAPNGVADDSGPEGGDSSPEPTKAPGTESGSTSEADSANKGGANRTAPQTRAVISTGTISLSSPDTEQARFDLRKVIDAHQGTIAEEEASTDDDGNLRNTRIVVRVPVKQFDKAMTELGKVADLTRSSRNTEDVTTKVIDNQVRIRAQEKSLKRIEALLARAEDLSDIVSIESQLSTRQADLDSLKSQQAYLQDQTSLSTITVHLEHEEGANEEKADEDDKNAFVTGLSAGWGALAAFGAGTATFVGALLPFVVLIGIVGVPFVMLLRRMSRRRVAAPQMAPEQS